MDLRSLNKDVRRGAVGLEEVLALLERLNRRLGKVERENRRLRERLAQYEPEIAKEPLAEEGDGADQCTRYSLADEERRRGAKRTKPERVGRVATAEKMLQADRIEELPPANERSPDAKEVSQRVVWRIENGQATRVGYKVFREPDGTRGEIPDVLPRGEYDLEIVVAVAYLTYIMRLSMDQVCELVSFFWKLPLQKSQADALLNELGTAWTPIFEQICDLLVHAVVVGTDETGWKVGTATSNTAVFSSEGETVLLFNCIKGRETLNKILPPEIFKGTVTCDDHATYQSLRKVQKCWPHLLRKAIKLTLLYPENATYREFLNGALAIFYEAKERRADKRLSDAGRLRLAQELAAKTRTLVEPHCSWNQATAARTPHAHDFELLAEEIHRLVELDQLFTFVKDLRVPADNNDSERTLRGPAQCRQLNRTSKSAAGAERRSVATTVLETLRKHLTQFDLSSVVTEIKTWTNATLNPFAQRLATFRQAAEAAATCVATAAAAAIKSTQPAPAPAAAPD